MSQKKLIIGLVVCFGVLLGGITLLFPDLLFPKVNNIAKINNVVKVANAAITSWTNTKTNDDDIMFLVNQGETITFSVSSNGVYEWQLNKAIQSATENSFTWTVPNEKDIWEIHTTDGIDHVEWVVSTLSISEAPDFFEYFVDGKISSRSATDPWGRSLPEWSFYPGYDSTMDASEKQLRLPYNIGESRSRLYTPTTTTFGTWKFKWMYPNEQQYTKGQLRFYPWGDFKYTKFDDAHNYFTSPSSVQMDEDSGLSPIAGKWYNITIIRTEDHWFYAYVDSILQYRWYENYTADDLTTRIELITNAGYPDSYLIFDCLEVYNETYLFPEKEIRYTGYIDNWYWEKPGIWNSEFKRINRTGIVVNGQNVTLSDINNSINNPSIFTYDAVTKTAIAYADIAVLDGAELVIKNETLKIHSNYDGEHQLAVLFGSTLHVENSTITSTNDHYYAFRLSSTTHFGYPVAYMFEITKSQVPGRLSYASSQSIYIIDSTINNTAYLFFDSPHVLYLKNVQFTNLNEIDIGNYSHHPREEAGFRKDFVRGDKSFWLFLKQLNLNGFEMSNVTFTGKEEPLNITIMLCDEREKLNFYNLNAENETIKIRKSVKMVSLWQQDWPVYLNGTLGLVNSKFGNLEVETDKTKILPKYYLDVLVMDRNGVPIPNANVTITNEQNDVDCPSENIAVFAMNNSGWYGVALPIISYSPLRSITTGSDGHTPLPSDKANTFVISDYVKDQTSQTNFTYNITASYGEQIASISSLDIDESWYREDPNTPTKTVVCNLGIGLCSLGGNTSDITPPHTSSHSPAKSATNISKQTNIILHIQDDGSGVDQSSIQMTVEGQIVSPTITGTTSDYILTYNPPTDFNYNQLVNVTIDASDLASTPNAMNTETYSFTVQSSPDSTPPTGSILINSGDSQTNSSTANLTISATDESGLSEMKISETNDFSSATAETYSTIKSFILSIGDGIKTIYGWFKDTVGNWNTSPYSDSIELDSTGPIISNIQETNITTNSSTITWTTNENSTSQIEYGLTSSYGSQTTKDSNLKTSHSVNLTELSDNTTYHYRIISEDSLTNSSNSTDQTFTTNQSVIPDSTSPQAINDLSSSSITQTSADLSWTSPGDDGNTGTASEYDIRYSTTNITESNWNSAIQISGEPIPQTAGTEQSIYIAVGLSPSTKYYFAIKTADEVPNTSNISNILSFTTLEESVSPPGGGGGGTVSDTTPPAKPSNFTATGADKQITLKWNNPTDSDFVRVKLLRKETSSPSSHNDSTTETIYEGTNQEYTDIELNNDTTYYYSIFAYDKKPNYSEILSISAKPIEGKTSISNGNGEELSYPEGTLLKIPESFKIYIIINQKKKWIPTPEVFETLGYQWTNITEINKTELNNIPNYEDNLIREINNYKIYLIVSGIKRHIPNPEIFLNYGFEWNDVKDVNQETINKYSQNLLIKESKQQKVYYLCPERKIRRWLRSPEIFNSYNNKWEDIQVISKYEMEHYRESNLIKLIGDNKVYLVENNTKRWIKSSEEFNRLGLDWEMVMEVNWVEMGR